MPAFTFEAQAILGYTFIVFWVIIALGCASRISFLFYDTNHPLAWPLVTAKIVLHVLLILWALSWAFLGELELIHPNMQWRLISSYVFNVIAVNGFKPMSIILFSAIVSTPAIQRMPFHHSRESRREVACHDKDAKRETFTFVDDLLVPGEIDDRESSSPRKLSAPAGLDVPMALFPPGLSDSLPYACAPRTPAGSPFLPYFPAPAGSPFLPYFPAPAAKAALDYPAPALCGQTASGRESVLGAEADARRPEAMSEATGTRGGAGSTASGSGGKSEGKGDSPWHVRAGRAVLHFICGSIPEECVDTQNDPTRWASLLRWRLALGMRMEACVWLVFLLLSIVFAVLASQGEIRNCDERTSEMVACKAVYMGTEEKQMFMPRTLSILCLASNALLLLLWTVKGVSTLERIGNIITKKKFQWTFLVGVLLLAALTLYESILMFESLRCNVHVNGVVLTLRNITEGYLVLLLMLRLGSGSRRMPKWYTSFVSLIHCEDRKLKKENRRIIVL